MVVFLEFFAAFEELPAQFMLATLESMPNCECVQRVCASRELVSLLSVSVTGQLATGLDPTDLNSYFSAVLSSRPGTVPKKTSIVCFSILLELSLTSNLQFHRELFCVYHLNHCNR